MTGVWGCPPNSQNSPKSGGYRGLIRLNQRVLMYRKSKGRWFDQRPFSFVLTFVDPNDRETISL